MDTPKFHIIKRDGSFFHGPIVESDAANGVWIEDHNTPIAGGFEVVHIRWWDVHSIKQAR